MTRIAERPDPRPHLFAALDQAQRQIDTIGSAGLSRPTPCAEYDVRTLIAHLVAVLRKLIVVRHGGDMTQVTDPADDLSDDCTATFQRVRADFQPVWAPDATLHTNYVLPWGKMTGSELLDAYTHEFTVHSWDLARVTGRVNELDPMLAEAALNWYSRNVPADDRPEGGPFAPPVTVAKDADAYTRLAGFLGRTAHA